MFSTTSLPKMIFPPYNYPQIFVLSPSLTLTVLQPSKLLPLKHHPHTILTTSPSSSKKYPTEISTLTKLIFYFILLVYPT
mmetsp:Transcript_45966/g.55750  ORF Transcript_45966/g.55750 Transcript_45966/m.55750 type:complete len:80 (-) Transcript_45966:74-313(-)